MKIQTHETLHPPAVVNRRFNSQTRRQSTAGFDSAMSEVVQIPRSEWENMKHQLEFLCKVIKPLAAGYKQPKWMSEQDVMDYLHIGRERLKQLRLSGQIRLEPDGLRKKKYHRGDIEAYNLGSIVIPSKRAQAAE